MENRYIMIREAKNGQSRYLASDKFQKDIVSLWVIEQTWKANKKPVAKLFLKGQDDFDKFTRAIHYQMSGYTHPGKTPECVRVNGLNVIFNESSAQGTKEMDLVCTPLKLSAWSIPFTFVSLFTPDKGIAWM